MAGARQQFQEVHEEVMTQTKRIDRSIGALGARWGMQSFFHQGFTIAATIWRHPTNHGRRFRAVARFISWQIEKRLFNRPRIIDFHGMKLYCHPDNTTTSAALYFNGLPDYWEMRFILAYPRPGDHFLDVGANAGVYSILAASCIGNAGSVDAFEPMEKSARRLEEQMVLNSSQNIRVHRLAVSNRNSEVEFGFSGSDAMMHIQRQGEAAASAVRVQSIRLDDFLSGKRYAMGKMDIEGAEPLALHGAHNKLRDANPPVWLLELAGYSQHYGMSSDEVIAFLDSVGYACAIYDPEQVKIIYTDRPWTYGVQNILAISKLYKEDAGQRIRAAKNP